MRKTMPAYRLVAIIEYFKFGWGTLRIAKTMSVSEAEIYNNMDAVRNLLTFKQKRF